MYNYNRIDRILKITQLVFIIIILILLFYDSLINEFNGLISRISPNFISLIALLTAIITVIEMQKNRKVMQSPDLVVEGRSDEVLHAKINFNDILMTPIKIYIRNIGIGYAKNISVIISCHLEGYFEEMKKMYSDLSFNILKKTERTTIYELNEKKFRFDNFKSQVIIYENNIVSMRSGEYDYLFNGSNLMNFKRLIEIDSKYFFKNPNYDRFMIPEMIIQINYENSQKNKFHVEYKLIPYFYEVNINNGFSKLVFKLKY